MEEIANDTAIMLLCEGTCLDPITSTIKQVECVHVLVMHEQACKSRAPRESLDLGHRSLVQHMLVIRYDSVIKA